MKKLVIVILVVALIWIAVEQIWDGGGNGYVDCSKCGGDGLCVVCDGRGANSYAGNPARTCTICGGNGKCQQCGGEGKVEGGDETKKVPSPNPTPTPNSSDKTCKTCYGSGLSSYKCTYCGGSGIDPAYEATEGKVIHSFAEKDCAKCGGSGRSRCTDCGGDGEY